MKKTLINLGSLLTLLTVPIVSTVSCSRNKRSGEINLEDIDSIGKLSANLESIKPLSTTYDLKDFSTVEQLIKSVDYDYGMFFRKTMVNMTPEDLRRQLLILRKETNGGNFTLHIKYKDKVSNIHKNLSGILNRVINAFGDERISKNLSGSWKEIVAKLIEKMGGDIFSSAGKLLKWANNYSGDITGNQSGPFILNLIVPLSNNGEVGENIKNKKFSKDTFRLVASLPGPVLNAFSDVFSIFAKLSEEAKNNPLARRWAKDNNQVEELKKFDHTLIHMVANLKSTKKYAKDFFKNSFK